MPNEVAVRKNAAGGLLAQFAEGHNPFLEAAAGATDFFGAFLKFNGNTGDFTWGEKEDELALGSELLVNMATAQRGWICWVEGEVEDERNFIIAEGQRFPGEEELPDHGPYDKHEDGTEDGWQEQYILHFYSEKLEQAFTYKTSSKSGLRSVRKLLKAYGSKATMKIGADGEIQVPLVEIDVAEFVLKNNKKAGKKYAPTFEIVEWVEFSEVADLFDSADNGGDAKDYDDDKDEKEEVSKPSRGAKEDTEDRPSRRRGREEPEPEPEAERPSRRRGGGDSAKEEPEAEAEDKPEGRRTSVRHAPPQDAEPEADTGESRREATGRDSARGRRGRTRD